MKQPDEPVGRRSRRRPGATDVSHAVFDRTRSYRRLRNPFEPLKVFSDDQVAAMHEAALSMLETQGMKVLSADARLIYRHAGAEVDEATQIVRLGRGLVGRFARHRAARHHAAFGRSRAPCAAVGQARRIRTDFRAAEHHERGRRAACRNARGFPQPDQVVPEFRSDPRARRFDRAAGRAGEHPASGSHAFATHALRQGAADFFAGTSTGGGQFRTHPARPRHHARGVRARGPTPTRSSIRTRRCSWTFRWPTASSISPRPVRC